MKQQNRLLGRTGLLSQLFASVLFLIALTGCDSIVGTTNFRVTIRVDGRDYTSDVVGQMKKDGYSGGGKFNSYGRVLTFRLPDDRVVVLGTYLWQTRLRCVPRLDQSDTGCKMRWALPKMHLGPDGFIFDSAVNPTSVEAFQFEPRDPEFAASGQYSQGNGYTPMPISHLTVELVSYLEMASQEHRPRDNLDRDFPGYDLTHFRDGEPIRGNPALSNAASDIGLPLKRDR